MLCRNAKKKMSCFVLGAYWTGSGIVPHASYFNTKVGNTNFLFSPFFVCGEKSHGFKLRFQSLRETRNVVEKKISTKEDNSAKIFSGGAWLASRI